MSTFTRVFGIRKYSSMDRRGVGPSFDLGVLSWGLDEDDSGGRFLYLYTFLGGASLGWGRGGPWIGLDTLLGGMEVGVRLTGIRGDWFCPVGGAGFRIGYEGFQWFKIYIYTFIGGIGTGSQGFFAVKPVSLRLYGNYGGPGYTAAKLAGEPGYVGDDPWNGAKWIPPWDELDAQFQIHDQDWYQQIRFRPPEEYPRLVRESNRKLVGNLRKLLAQPVIAGARNQFYCRLVAWLGEVYFRY
jgi:hypothetical protein